jgi:hypothetical protein
MKIKILIVILAVYSLFFSGCGGGGGAKKDENKEALNLIKGRVLTFKTSSSGEEGFKIKFKELENFKKTSGFSKIALLRKKVILKSIKRRTQKYQISGGYIPLSGATVIAVDIEENKQIGNPGKCDSNGYFELRGIPPETKNFVIIAKKLESQNNIIVIKTTITRYSGGILEIDNLTPQTTLATESYAATCKKIYEQDRENYDPDKIDYRKFLFIYEKMEIPVLLKLYKEQDLQYEEIYAKNGEKGLFQSASNISPTIDEITRIILASEDAFETSLFSQVEELEQKLPILNISLNNARENLRNCLKIYPEPISSYYEKLATKLNGLNISTTPEILYQEIEFAENRLNEILNKKNPTNAEINSAWERYFVEEMMIFSGIRITGEISQKIEELFNILISDYHEKNIKELWKYATNEITKLAAKSLNLNFTDEEIDIVNSLIYKGCYDENKDSVCEMTIPLEQILQNVYYTVGYRPDCTISEEIYYNPCINDECVSNWNTYFSTFNANYNSKVIIELKNILFENLGWESDKIENILKVRQRAERLIELPSEVDEEIKRDWCNYWNNYGTNIKNCWDAYENAKNTAFSGILNLTPEQISLAFSDSCEAYERAVQEIPVNVYIEEGIILELKKNYCKP